MSAADAVQAKLHAAIERACKMLALEVDKELRRRGVGTPVDTGHARANWIPSVGRPFSSVVPGASSAQHDTGVAQVLSFRIGQGTLYVANNVPYIRRLNDGHSKQAPALFIEAAIYRALVTVKGKTGFDLGIESYANGVSNSAANNVASAYSPFSDE